MYCEHFYVACFGASAYKTDRWLLKEIKAFTFWFTMTKSVVKNDIYEI